MRTKRFMKITAALLIMVMTVTMLPLGAIAAAMEQKQLGLASKPMFVVPNNIVGDFAADFLRLYPSANILVATQKDFEKKNVLVDFPE